MPEIGQTISHYRIIEKLGQGGMGEVFLTHDTSLDRKVALKFLPDIFSGDPERLARFEREAKLLASLNHPNIATIHGFEQADGKRFLAMELVEGETLAQQIERGPLPVDEALEVCRQIAEGLEAAHEKGVIHRDLKPANVKITPEGKVKILDFGLAKAFQEESASADLSHSPTLSEAMTHVGVILGTAAYMSPEQAKGKAVDKRSDIWSFGCVLYECLTSKRAFDGETVSETIASILKGEPDWKLLPNTTPLSVVTLLRRCLEKDKRRRKQDILDARIELEETLEKPTIGDQPELAAMGKTSWRLLIVLLFGAVIITAATVFILTRHFVSPQPGPVMKVEISIEPAQRLGGSTSAEKRVGFWRPSHTSIALSPDGDTLVFEGVTDKGSKLYSRSIGRDTAKQISGTEGGLDPFFSPDGDQVGFYCASKLLRIPIEGGIPTKICDLSRPTGVSWGPNDMIVYSNGTRLLKVAASGGKPEPLTTPNRENGERSHLLPHILPGNDALLFCIKTEASTWYDPKIAILSLKTLQWKMLDIEGADARYSPSGHIIFARQGALWAVPFDLHLQKITGDRRAIVPDVMQAGNGTNTDISTFAAQYCFSNTGTMAYVPGGKYPDFERFLVSIGLDGTIEPLSKEPRDYFRPRMSADHKIAYKTYGKERYVGIYDQLAGYHSRVVSAVRGTPSGSPLWIPDGKRLLYRSGDPEEVGNYTYVINTDGTGKTEKLPIEGTPASLSHDGKLLAVVKSGTGTGYDISVYSLEQNKEETFLDDTYDEAYPAFSPNGRYIAYTSNREGRSEVYVTSYPNKSQVIRVSNKGGISPVWSPDMRHLYYLEESQRSRARMICADMDFRSNIPVTNRRTLFDNWGLLLYFGNVNGFDLSPDGNIFVGPALLYGGKPIRFSDIPKDILDGLDLNEQRSLAWFARWLKEDKDRVFSPELERMLKGETVNKIQITFNWFEELKRQVPVK
jgi:eukaryotic-like serine/threonine-protein kinase